MKIRTKRGVIWFLVPIYIVGIIVSLLLLGLLTCIEFAVDNLDDQLKPKPTPEPTKIPIAPAKLKQTPFQKDLSKKMV